MNVPEETGISKKKSLRNDGTQWFVAVAAFPIPVHSKDFAEKLSKWLFRAKLFTEGVTTALFRLQSGIADPSRRPPYPTITVEANWSKGKKMNSTTNYLGILAVILGKVKFKLDKEP